MGNFYVNLSLRASREELLPVLQRLGRHAYVAFTEGFAVVCDEECDSQRLDSIAALAATLSVRLARPVLAALNHDDDVLLCALYDGDEVVSEFGSRSPLAFGVGIEVPSTSRRSFVRAVRAAFATEPRPLPQSLKGARLYFWLFAFFRHALLAADIGLPSACVGAGFRYAARGDIPGAEGVQFELVRLLS